MATKKQSKNTKSPSTDSKVTRISASDTDQPKKTAAKSTVAPAKKTVKAKTATATKSSKSRNPLKATAGYFAGAWKELTQVRWPNRRETWSLTLAVIIFTAFFVGLIVLLDYVFGELFKLVIN